MSEKKESMICVHSHVLYGVDDGSESFFMSRMLLQLYREQGIYRIFATPHSLDLKGTSDQAESSLRKLVEYVEENYPDMSIFPGSEVYCESSMMDEVLKNLDSGCYPTLNHNRCVLMEGSPWTYPEDMVACVKALADAGYIPVVAHMERYKALRNNLALVDQLIDLGALIQVNVYSLFDVETEPICAWARQLVLSRKVTFLGTDSHRPHYRPPSSAMGLAWLREMVEQGMLDEEYADAIAIRNAEKLLIGGPERNR